MIFKINDHENTGRTDGADSVSLRGHTEGTMYLDIVNIISRGGP
jgi:hypothetical protein